MTTTYTIGQIAQSLGISIPQAQQSRPISYVSTDSRTATEPSKTLFLAFRTQNNDGHKYVAQLYEKGVRAFVITDPSAIDKDGCPDAIFLHVQSSLEALRCIASMHRQNFYGKIIGITGSKGKTSTKEWLYQILRQRATVTRSPRSYNSMIGLPLSIWQCDNTADYAIFESGISAPEQMFHHSRLLQPDIVLITNITTEHDEAFTDRYAKCCEKAQLASSAECVIYCGDDATLHRAVTETAQNPKRKAISWSAITQEADIYFCVSKSDGRVSVYQKGEAVFDFVLPDINECDINNIFGICAMLMYLGLSSAEITSAISGLTPTTNRIDVMDGLYGSTLIYDTFTCDTSSVIHAIDFSSRRITSNQSFYLILGDVDTDCPQADYDQIVQTVRLLPNSRIIAIGNDVSQYISTTGIAHEVYSTVSEFLKRCNANHFANSTILVKSCANSGFQGIVDMLEARQHETVLEVNLDAVVHNYNLFKSVLKPPTGIICMVKASGYGAGSFELAKTLQSQGASYLAVAVMDEGVALRNAGITMPIMVLNPHTLNYRSLFRNSLEPEIYSLDLLREIIEEGRKLGVNNYPVHIKIDTGMHRLGFEMQDIPQLIELLRNQDVVKPASVFSHLAVADDPSMDDYTASQFDVFDRVYKLIQKEYPYRILRHILNSTGIVRFPYHQYDMVRLGICLYGVATMPDDAVMMQLKPVSSLLTNIIAIKRREEGTTIGYGRRGVIRRTSAIATIPVGYADGLNRRLSCGKHKVLVRGKLCPIVGNICMDACMIDVTDVPDVAAGDRVEIFGDNIPVSTIADTLGTISYEVLTSVSTRVKRIYYRG